MLENLATVPWSELNQCYGKATDIPALIKTLASTSSAERREALQQLWSYLYHQGSVYKASAAAVPFLCELLRSPDVRGKFAILHLVISIGQAANKMVHDDPIWRRAIPYPSLAHCEVEANQADLDCKSAVTDEVTTFLQLLTAPSPRIRGHAALGLLACNPAFSRVDGWLRKRIRRERHHAVKAALVHVWARLGRNQSGTLKLRLRTLALNHNENGLVRLIAGLALAPLLPDSPGSKFAQLLTTLLRKYGHLLDRFIKYAGGFEFTNDLVTRPQLKYQILMALAESPTAYWKDHVPYLLEGLCRERRSRFPAVIATLGRLLNDPDPKFRKRIVGLLSNQGTWVRHAQLSLVRALADKDADVAIWAAGCLSKLCDPDAIRFLITQLEQATNWDLPREEGSPYGLPMEFGVPASPQQKNMNRLGSLLSALCRLGTDAAEALPSLCLLFAKSGPQVRNRLVVAIASIGELAADLVPAVAEMLKSPATQASAVRALAKWGQVARPMISDLIQFLQQFPAADRWAKMSAIEALGNFGADASAALPTLQACLKDADVAVKCKSAVAIWKIAPSTPGPVETLRNELSDSTKHGHSTHNSLDIVIALRELGRAASSCAPTLEKLLSGPDGWVRVHAARALIKMGAQVQVILPTLIDDLLRKWHGIGVGQLAAECIASLGPAAAPALSRIEEILSRDDTFAHFGTDWADSDEAYRNALLRAKEAITGIRSFKDDLD